jgi:DNA-binding NtrC family response regulator
VSQTEKPYILIVDDEPDIRELVKDILEDEGYRATTASDGQSAREFLKEHTPQLILLDIWMPDIDGVSLLREFKQNDASLTVVMMSGHGTIETAIEATRLGACDFIEKPLSTAKLIRSVETALENKKKQSISKQFQSVEPVGKSPQATMLRKQAQRVAKHTMPILLIGEGGVGKHCYAHYLHSLGAYSQGRFLELTAESFPTDSLKFTALAKNNCLYINNVSQLDGKAQALLLHLLENQKLSDCQLIFSNQSPIEEAVDNETFDEALLYQINSITLVVPSLRDHVDDIPELLNHFVDQHTTESQLPYRHFTVAAQNRLRNYPWPGNVVELKNIVQRLLVFSENEDIDESDIDRALQPLKQEQDSTGSINYELPLRDAREQFERIYLLYKLQQTDGNVGKAAKLAGMERTHLYRKLRSLNIDSKQV